MARIQRARALVVQNCLPEIAQPILRVPEVIKDSRVPIARPHQLLITSRGFVIARLGVSLIGFRELILVRGPKTMMEAADQDCCEKNCESYPHGRRLSISSRT